MDSIQFSFLVNTKKIEGASWDSRNLGPLHKTIKLGELSIINKCRRTKRETWSYDCPSGDTYQNGEPLSKSITPKWLSVFFPAYKWAKE